MPQRLVGCQSHKLLGGIHDNPGKAGTTQIESFSRCLEKRRDLRTGCHGTSDPPPPARAETWASSWPEDSDDGGTPSGTGASGTLVDEDADGVNGRFEACSAVRACLTALTTDARKVGEG